MCCQDCKFKNASAVCRPAISSCDIVEVCDGKSGSCPEDKYLSDGTSCGSNNLACASGQCTSRDQQCSSRGSSLGITKACSLVTDSDCSIRCANPTDSSSCLELNGYFVDGTPCGFGGRCNQGKCSNGSISTCTQIVLYTMYAYGLFIYLRPFFFVE